MDVSRVQVVTQSTLEHGRVLGDDSKATAEIKEASCRHIKTVNAILVLVESKTVFSYEDLKHT